MSINLHGVAYCYTHNKQPFDLLRPFGFVASEKRTCFSSLRVVCSFPFHPNKVVVPHDRQPSCLLSSLQRRSCRFIDTLISPCMFIHSFYVMVTNGESQIYLYLMGKVRLQHALSERKNQKLLVLLYLQSAGEQNSAFLVGDESLFLFVNTEKIEKEMTGSWQ